MKLLDQAQAEGYSRVMLWEGGEAEVVVTISGTATVILKEHERTSVIPTAGSDYTEVDSTDNTTTFTASGKIGRRIGRCYLVAHVSAYTSGTVTLEVRPITPGAKPYVTQVEVS